MSKRKTAQQRIEEYRIKADKLEAAAKRRALKNSPAWKATFKAMKYLDEALAVLSLYEGGQEGFDEDHGEAVSEALRRFDALRAARFDS